MTLTDWHPNQAPIPFAPDQGLAILYNPTSLRAKEHSEDIFSDAKYTWAGKGKIINVPTEETIQDNAELLSEIQREGPYHLTVIGGDGTHGMLLNASIVSKFQGVSSLFPAGNCNDLANMSNNSLYIHDPIGALRDGTKGVIRPLEVTIQEDKNAKPEIISAIGYVGIGVSGSLAEYFDSEDYRKSEKGLTRFNQYSREFKTALSHILNANTFTIYNGENNEREAIEYLILNGGRMAKTRFLPYSKLFKPEATIAEVSNNKFRTVLSAVGKLAIGGKTLHRNEEVSFVIYDKSERPIYLQIDGEHKKLPNGTRLSFGISEDTVSVATTRF